MREGTDPDDVEQLWSQLGDDYFLKHTAADVAWHSDAILQQPADGGPLVLIKETTQREFEGGTQIFIYAPDQHDFFAVTVAAMSQLNLNIHDARIITSSSQFTLDTYIVLDNDGGSIGDNPQRVKQIRDGLTEALRNPEDYPTIIQRRVPRQLKHFDFPPQVTILNDAQRPVTILEITAPDRPACWPGWGGSSPSSTCRCRTPRSPPSASGWKTCSSSPMPTTSRCPTHSCAAACRRPSSSSCRPAVPAMPALPA